MSCVTLRTDYSADFRILQSVKSMFCHEDKYTSRRTGLIRWERIRNMPSVCLVSVLRYSVPSTSKAYHGSLPDIDSIAIEVSSRPESTRHEEPTPGYETNVWVVHVFVSRPFSLLSRISTGLRYVTLRDPREAIFVSNRLLTRVGAVLWRHHLR